MRLARQRRAQFGEQRSIDIGGMYDGALQTISFAGHGIALARKEFPAFIVDEPELPPRRG